MRRLNAARRPATGPELSRDHRVTRLRFATDHQNWTDWCGLAFLWYHESVYNLFPGEL